MSTVRYLFMAALSLAIVGSLMVPAPARQDDDEAEMRELLARRSLEENCLICHTMDLIAGQRLTPAQWKAEVVKMIGWGSPLPKEAADPVTEFLARHYSDREPTPVPTLATLKDVDSYEVPKERNAPAEAGADLKRGEKLYATTCANCHGPKALGGDLGPALVHKAILDRPTDYNRILFEGLRRMPGNKQTLKPEDSVAILAWLRSLSYPVPLDPGGR